MPSYTSLHITFSVITPLAYLHLYLFTIISILISIFIIKVINNVVSSLSPSPSPDESVSRPDMRTETEKVNSSLAKFSAHPGFTFISFSLCLCLSSFLSNFNIFPFPRDDNSLPSLLPLFLRM